MCGRQDADGYISTSDLAEALVSLGELATPAFISRMIQAADFSGDGLVRAVPSRRTRTHTHTRSQVSYEEFVQVVYSDSASGAED